VVVLAGGSAVIGESALYKWRGNVVRSRRPNKQVRTDSNLRISNTKFPIVIMTVMKPEWAAIRGVVRTLTLVSVRRHPALPVLYMPMPASPETTGASDPYVVLTKIDEREDYTVLLHGRGSENTDMQLRIKLLFDDGTMTN
jgi:hypothetical protein